MHLYDIVDGRELPLKQPLFDGWILNVYGECPYIMIGPRNGYHSAYTVLIAKDEWNDVLINKSPEIKDMETAPMYQNVSRCLQGKKG